MTALKIAREALEIIARTVADVDVAGRANRMARDALAAIALTDAPQAAVPAIDLAAIDAAFAEEILAVSEVEYNSNMICRSFYRMLRKRLAASATYIPDQPQRGTTELPHFASVGMPAPTIPTPCQDVATMGNHACKGRNQCWEPCGELGNSAEHAKRAPEDALAAIAAAESAPQATVPEGEQKYCATCEKLVSTPCSSADCETPDLPNHANPSKELRMIDEPKLTALGDIQHLLKIMLASATALGNEWVEGYQIKCGALHKILGVMHQAGFPVSIPLPNADTMTEALLNCPFCGGELLMQEHPAHEHFIVDLPPSSGSWTIECAACPCGMIADTKSEVIEIWNRRTPQPSGLPAAKDERDAFEAYCKQPFLDYPVRQRDYDGGYVDSTTQDIWVGWQARAALYDRPQPARAALTDEQAYKLLDEAVDFSENFAGGSTTELSKDAVSAILVRRLLAMAASQPQEPK